MNQPILSGGTAGKNLFRIVPYIPPDDPTGQGTERNQHHYYYCHSLTNKTRASKTTFDKQSLTATEFVAVAFTSSAP